MYTDKPQGQPEGHNPLSSAQASSPPYPLPCLGHFRLTQIPWPPSGGHGRGKNDSSAPGLFFAFMEVEASAAQGGEEEESQGQAEREQEITVEASPPHTLLKASGLSTRR